jgi:hypothetical protein
MHTWVVLTMRLLYQVSGFRRGAPVATDPPSFSPGPARLDLPRP